MGEWKLSYFSPRWRLRVLGAMSGIPARVFRRTKIATAWFPIFILPILVTVYSGILKARLLTGTCMLQAMESKYSAGKESAICKCCGIENEDITHFLLNCPALFQKRKLYYSQLKESVINMIGIDNWNIQFRSKLDIVKLMMDCTFLAPLLKMIET